ncbi:alpha/beta hydrolase [Paraburkholderia bengalensis]|uniref:Alpha/beta hydrolase n=1 Tax=Paraburkholderia bengalensis TaxID=2747562 RepID=A0ABU8J4J2_9BURK
MNANLDIANVTIAGHRHPIVLRTYQPTNHRDLPVVLLFHGGGFTAGGLDHADAAGRFIASEMPARVVSVAYSLAPKFPFPAATEDAYAALCWARQDVCRHGARPTRTAAVGHEAGGNIAAGLAAIARDRGNGLHAHALLAPWLDPSMTRLQMQREALPADSEASACARAYRAYLPDVTQRLHPYAAPLESTRFATLPATSISTAEQDLARADGETYASRLLVAGVPVEITRYSGVAASDLLTDSRALNDIVAFLRKHLSSRAVAAR